MIEYHAFNDNCQPLLVQGCSVCYYCEGHHLSVVIHQLLKTFRERIAVRFPGLISINSSQKSDFSLPHLLAVQ